MSADARRIVAAQGLRAAGYGCTAVLLGALLAARSYSPLRAGVVLGALVAGTAGASLLVGAVADRVGRRQCYVALFLGVAAAGAAVATGAAFWVLLVVALSGLLSTDVRRRRRTAPGSHQPVPDGRAYPASAGHAGR